MGSKICMNSSCGTATTHKWKNGWPLRSGGFAHLCYRCGSAYEDSVYCDTFHLEESGWRKCHLCGKRLHCGCIASKCLLELLDYGGVGCTSCATSSRLHSVRRIQTNGDEIPKGFSTLPMKNAGSSAVEGKSVGDHVDEGTCALLCKIMEADERNLLPRSQRANANSSLGQHRGEEVMCPIRERGAGFTNAMQPYVRPPNFAKTNNSRPALDVRDIHDSLSQPCLSVTLGGSSKNPNFVLPFSSGLADGKEQSKTSSSFQQGQRSHLVLPKPSKSCLATSSEMNKSVVPQAQIARPPVEGGGKNHLLARYWPRITFQELQKLSGDLKSTIVPLFEKVLSASDAGRIGRLVLPKACAEAYFPPISLSEGLPLRIQDVKGKEWTFQFRFWPNNNSRMYVLEGVTPCIQSMQLQAGDTVTFSRIDPGGKLVMGFRKAANSDAQAGQTSTLPNGAHSGETSHFSAIENLSTVSAFSGLFQTLKGDKDSLVNALSEHLGLPDGNISRGRGENHGDGANEDPLQPAVNAEKKRTRNIGSKSKRLLMHNEDALELRLTWEEAQDMLRPPPGVRPSIVTIEDYKFEEYDEPPVFGRRTIFADRPSGGQEQWALCDDCSKWRRLPMDVLLPPKWTCSDNVWDSSRCSCSAPEESLKELENLLKMGRDLKKRKILESHKLAPEREPSGLDALASAAVLGDKMGDVGESSSGATTKHPRHRPGCTCIVCIQPPSGKGKHKPTCTCNVCLTVKRRFRTLMLRKKRQSEREAEISQKDNNEHKNESELDDTRHNHTENEGSRSRIQAEVAETSTGQIDLNCHPNREDVQLDEPGLNMMTLVQVASMPVENYIQHNGIASEQQGSLASHLLTQANRENERRLSDDEFLASVGWERDKRSDEGHKELNMERTGLQ